MACSGLIMNETSDVMVEKIILTKWSQFPTNGS